MATDTNHMFDTFTYAERAELMLRMDRGRIKTDRIARVFYAFGSNKAGAMYDGMTDELQWVSDMIYYAGKPI